MKTLNISNSIGLLGENIACRYLVSKGHTIVARNYLEKTGEIDIVSKINSELHFCEVKSRSVDSLGALESITSKTDYIFSNIHPKKLSRFKKTIELYLMRQNVPHETKWQIDIVGVYVLSKDKNAKVVMIENVV